LFWNNPLRVQRGVDGACGDPVALRGSIHGTEINSKF
jgi:hypothetical protein